MSKKNILVSISIAVFLISTSMTLNSVTLEKIWVVEKYNSENQTKIYRQESKLRDAMGFQLLADGKAKIRQNTNWCGTTFPGEKINYETVDGTWHLTTDSILVINYIQFGDSTTSRLRIISLTEQTLIVKDAFLP